MYARMNQSPRRVIKTSLKSILRSDASADNIARAVLDINYQQTCRADTVLSETVLVTPMWGGCRPTTPTRRSENGWLDDGSNKCKPT
jgi:hypothetical protein